MPQVMWKTSWPYLEKLNYLPALGLLSIYPRETHVHEHQNPCTMIIKQILHEKYPN